jgi:uncharacterized protein (TIGR00255 family)
MLKSMTAYGRSSISSSVGRFAVEIQSVNRKHLELNVFLPKELTRFESDIRKLISRFISRGQVTIKLFAKFDTSTPVSVIPNLPLVRQLKAAWDEIAQEVGLDKKNSFSLSLIQNETGVITYGEDLQNEEVYRNIICQAIEEALKGFVEMRNREGKELQTDIEARLSKMQKWIVQIEKLAPGATEKYRQKLIERLNEVVPGTFENEERILREVCLYAERIDISEEITRFNSHLKQAEILINNNTGSQGKTFEFLLQELNREINTIGSKSSDVEVSKLVIEVKSELEKIREQIQNVE